ncbi:MAG: hypothetical protein IPN18_17605 [Ignavibacteriales bacterium]|nr:hypothetical protein [Ignavibacteriales bacterium]
MANIKANRSGVAVENSLEIKNAAENGNNPMPIFVKAAANYVNFCDDDVSERTIWHLYRRSGIFKNQKIFEN